ncbi:MAG: tail fiber domain-containing protein [Prolixibacteraceae bacterium]
MKKKSLLKLLFVFCLLAFVYGQLKAQEIEVTDNMLYLRSDGSRGTVYFYPDGTLLLASWASTAFAVNVSNSSARGLQVLNNWTYPAAFEVYGSGLVTANGIALYSDSTAKENIQPLDSQIDQLKKLTAVSYKWKDKDIKGEKESYGLLAQDLEKVYPDMVFLSDSGKMGIFYSELIPVLIEVTKEQQALIEAQAQQLLDIEKRLIKLEKKNK